VTLPRPQALLSSAAVRGGQSAGPARGEQRMLQTLTIAAVLGAAGPVPIPSATSPRPFAADKEKFILGLGQAQAERVGPFVQLTPVAPAPRPLAELTAAYRLRNVAAADVSHALQQHFRDAACEGSVSAVAAANEVVVRGSVGAHARVAALVADLDRTPTMIDITTTMVQVPVGFLRECGLARPGAAGAVWSLTEREAALFSVALRHHPKLTVLSRPQVRVADGQTAHVQVGQEVAVSAVEPAGPGRRVDAVPTGVTTRLTPRLSPDGTAMLLRVETQVSVPAPRQEVGSGAAFPVNVQTAHWTTVAVTVGRTAVLSVPTTGADGTPAELLYVINPTVHRP
jgi:type II secretory pathway component GspD/PulD (secretin)